MNKESILVSAKAILSERFGKDSLIAFATVEDGVPYTRTIDAYYEEGAFYAITYALSNKMRQIEKSPTVALSGEWFTAHGTAMNLGWFCEESNQEIAAKLKKAFSSWIENGHNNFEDKNTIILKVVLKDAVIFCNGQKYDVDFLI